MVSLKLRLYYIDESYLKTTFSDIIIIGKILRYAFHEYVELDVYLFNSFAYTSENILELLRRVYAIDNMVLISNDTTRLQCKEVSKQNREISITFRLIIIINYIERANS